MTTPATTSSVNLAGQLIPEGGVNCITTAGRMPICLAPTSPRLAPDTLLLLLGGLGSSQWYDRHGHPLCPKEEIALALQGQTEVIHLAYADRHLAGQVIAEARAKYPSIKRTVVAQHSMSFKIAAYLALGGWCNYLVAVDPVGTKAPLPEKMQWPHVGDHRFPGLFLKASPTCGITQLYVEDGPEPIPTGGGHNDLNATILNLIVAACATRANEVM